MKRQPPNPAPELSVSLGRKRALSDEELALWESVAKQIKPLRKKPRAAKLQTVSEGADAEAATAAKQAAAAKPLPAAKTPKTRRLEPPPEAPPLALLGRRERAQLSRGRKQIEARLDLHGMTQTRAHRALSGFLQRAHRDGLRFVLVITGKGRAGADSERGVLRR